MSSKVNLSTTQKNFVFHDIDDFWSDCVNASGEVKESKMNTSESQPRADYITFNENFDMRFGRSNTQTSRQSTHSNLKKEKDVPISQKHLLDRVVSKEQLNAEFKERNKKKKAAERCYLLYEKGKIKNEVNRIMFLKNEELKVQNEMKDCTWKPQLNKINKQLEHKLLSNGMKIYNRSIKWLAQNSQKISRSKSAMTREGFDQTYQPQVNQNPNLQNMFDDNKSILHEPSNRTFVYRLNKARQEESEKRALINKNIGKLLLTSDKYKGSNSNLVRSVSMDPKTTHMMKQTLRDELASIIYDSSDTEGNYELNAEKSGSQG